MNKKILSYIIPQTVFLGNSKHNGTIKVIESSGKRYIDAGGLMQSGPFLEMVWKKGLQKLKIPRLPIRSVLILGLGGGSFVSVIKKIFPHVAVTAVEIDPEMVRLGKEFLKLADYNVDIHIQDAQKFIVDKIKRKEHYDLVFTDMYVGFKIPQFVEEEQFLQQLLQLKSKNGILIFNRLFFQTYKNEAIVFLDKLKKIYQDVEVARVYSNLLIKVS